MVKSVRKRMVKTKTASNISCKCGNTRWKYNQTLTKLFDSSTEQIFRNGTTQSDISNQAEEFRCTLCNKKASIEIAAELRKLPIYTTLQRIK